MFNTSDVSGPPSGACPGCGIRYPRTVAYFYRDSGNRDGLKTRCRDCVCAAERRRYAASAEMVRQRVRERRAERAAYFETQPQWQAA